MEGILATLPGSSQDERLVIVLSREDGATQLIMRQQSWGEGVGWYTQKTMEIEPSQIPLLRTALGTASGVARPMTTPPATSSPTTGQESADSHDSPRTLRIVSA